MVMRRLVFTLAAALLFPLVATYSWSAEPAKETETSADDNPGQADLDRAVQAKLGAESPAELGEVISLAQRALDKGLDDANATFARKLLAASLFHRGRMVAEAIFAPPRPDPRWPQLRKLAVADLERSLKHEPAQPAAQLLVGRLESLPGGDRKTALSALEEAVRLSDDEPEVQVEALMMHVGLDENPEHRLADLSKIVDLKPSDPVPLRLRGSLQLQMNRPAEALVDIDAAIKLDPKNAGTYEVRGLCLAMLQRLDEARESYGKAVELAPKSPALLIQRAQVNYLSEKFDAAVSDINEALKIDPDNGPAKLLRAQSLARMGKTDPALADVDAVLKQRPKFGPALRTRAIIEASTGKTEEAISDLAELSEQEPDDLELRLQMALLYRSMKNFAKAVEVLTDALEEEPESWLLHYSRADIYLSMGKHAEAVADYEIAVTGQPKEAGLLNNYAWLLATSPSDKVRNGRKAVELATRACEITEHKQAHILSTLAASYAETGDFEAAARWSKKALEVAAGDDDVQANLRKELASYEAHKPWREMLVDDKPLQTVDGQKKAPLSDSEQAEKPAGKAEKSLR